MLFHISLENLHHFLCGIIAEYDFRGNAAAQTLVLVHEFLHVRSISRQDHHQAVPVVFDIRQQRINGFPAKLILVILAQGIGLIDEQNAAHGFFDLFGNLQAGGTHILAHQIPAGAFYQLTCGQDVQTLIDLADDPGHGGLTGTGISQEYHVQGTVTLGTCDAALLPQLLYPHLVDDLIYLGLDFRQTGHLIQLLQQILHGFGGCFALEILRTQDVILHFRNSAFFGQPVGLADAGDIDHLFQIPGILEVLLLHKLLQPLFNPGAGLVIQHQTLLVSQPDCHAQQLLDGVFTQMDSRKIKQVCQFFLGRQ